MDVFFWTAASSFFGGADHGHFYTNVILLSYTCRAYLRVCELVHIVVEYDTDISIIIDIYIPNGTKCSRKR